MVQVLASAVLSQGLMLMSAVSCTRGLQLPRRNGHAYVCSTQPLLIPVGRA